MNVLRHVPRPAAAALLLLLALAACTADGARREQERARSLDAALTHYGRLVRAMASDSIAGLYTADGELVTEGQPTITGRDAIRAFLHRFDDYRVLAHTLVVDSARIAGDSGIQHGRYAQRVRLPAGDTVEVSGYFTAEWVPGPDGEWRIRRMGTSPIR